MSIQYLPIFWSEYPMTCAYIDELYVVVLSCGDMDVAVGRGYRTYPSPNMSKNKALLCLQSKVWHLLRKVRHRLRKAI